MQLHLLQDCQTLLDLVLIVFVFGSFKRLSAERMRLHVLLQKTKSAVPESTTLNTAGA